MTHDLAVRTAPTETPMHALIAERWSPRGLDASHELDDVRLASMLEAARWAPSAFNSQPWRFVVARRGSVAFRTIYERLTPSNQLWVHRASALVVAVSVDVDSAGRPLTHARYDVGQAVAQLSLQAVADGLVVHQLGGFDAAGLASDFTLPTTMSALVVVAVGSLDPTVELPEALAARERAPRERLSVSDLVLDVSTPGIAISA